MSKPPRWGKPTQLFDLMDQAPTYQKKMEVAKRNLDGLTGGQLGLAGALLIRASDTEGLNKGYNEIADIVGVGFLQVMQGLHIIRAGTTQQIQ